MAAGRTQVSIRARVIVAVVVLTGLALLLSGIVIYLQGVSGTVQRVSADLARAADEVALLADANDPDTGKPFATTEALLRVAMQRAVLPPTEGSFALVGDRIRWTSQPGVILRPEEDPELVAAVIPLAQRPQVSEGDLSTRVRDYRYIVVPVRFAGTDDAGALVRVSDIDAEQAVFQSVYVTYGLVALGSLALVAMLIWLFVGRLLRPLSWMRETAERITDTDITQRIPVRGNDDLSALGVTVNHMLDRLESTVRSQRDLLDDVGHELRTPLTIVRGHLELLDSSDAEDVAATRSLVLDELERMHRLVDDLLTLAKADHPGFVQPEPTDIARLTDETLAKATTLGERHWVLDELADAEVELDPQRIAQAWLQLAANAVQYSAVGTRVGMGSRLAGGELWFWVSDEGVGIPQEERARILSRRVRGRSGEGTGLGLAIVSSIAQAHRGRVVVESDAGVGSRIAVVVPATTAGEEPHESDPDR